MKSAASTEIAVVKAAKRLFLSDDFGNDDMPTSCRCARCNFYRACNRLWAKQKEKKK